MERFSKEKQEREKITDEHIPSILLVKEIIREWLRHVKKFY